MGEVKHPDRDVDQVLQRVRAELVKVRHTDSASRIERIPWSQPNLPAGSDPLAPGSPARLMRASRPKAQPALADLDLIPCQPTFKPKADGRYHYGDLLVYYDRAFVHSAYWAILRRAPDKGGLETYLKKLRAGISKVEILGLLRYSPEGRIADVTVSGLMVPFAISRICHWPIVGPPLRLFTAFLNSPETERKQRVFEDQVIALVEQTQANFQESLRRISYTLRDLEDSFDCLTAYVACKPGRDAVNRLEISIAALNEAVADLRTAVPDKEDSEVTPMPPSTPP